MAICFARVKEIPLMVRENFVKVFRKVFSRWLTKVQMCDRILHKNFRRNLTRVSIMEKATVVVIGGGATGLGILRDLSMRGVKALLVEKNDLVNGASSRYHGLLHSGGRYAVKDQEAARECIIENQIMRKIGKSCVEPCGGMFTRLDIDDPAYEELWVKGCADSGIEATPITLEEAFRLEPRLSRKHVKSAYLVPDAAVDGFRMAWQLIDSSKRYGGELKTYT